MRRGVESDSAPLRKHDAFDEVEAQTVTWNIRVDISPSIEGLKQLPLIC